MSLPGSAADRRRALRDVLVELRQEWPDRLQRAASLQEVLRVWLLQRPEQRMGAYWPIKGEFDPLPALYRWSEDHPERRIGLPVKHKDTGLLSFHVWYPGCPMEEDAFGILKPKDTEQFEPELLLVPCLGFGAGGLRVGYGGGFVDRTLRQREPHPVTCGLAYSVSWVPGLEPLEGDRPLDTLLTDEGVVWGR
ncbi:5-formyltetrahydrofolate cyclo-ligase [Inhella gelatinilytica]|uniref:5-formyltetrahydrofolate cyclo-ligase n=1 Tax=Inhella gelatinilytica TaxID=2795030 RepID=A0A931IYL3_9BURK|nr:5-formyltetrahydrofolate cyclo-ligase [Inhella gelatinilytica]MBH9552211.1 5-formyltetrahydrofolate cyclo-ligase [Inhella gelatinilytica]